jgi:hypothetical protein
MGIGERNPAKPSKGDEQLAAMLGAIANLNDSMGQLHQGLKTLNGVRRLGAEPRPVVNGQSGRISNSVGRLVGYSFSETTGAAPAWVRLRDGSDANGDLIASIKLLAGTSTNPWRGNGISFSYGLFVEVVAGSIEGVVYLGTTQ